MTLHLVQIPVNMRTFYRLAADRGWSGGRGVTFDEGRALHHLTTETFGPGVFQPFRLMVSPRGQKASLYAYSAKDAAGLRDAVRLVGLPEVADLFLPETIRSQPRPNVFKAGQRLGFDVLVRPVRRLRHERPNPKAAADASSGKTVYGKGAEIDAWQLHGLETYPDGPPATRNYEDTREGVYRDWLARRLEDAATLDLETVQLVKFSRRAVVRDGAVVEGPDAVLHGTLSVKDPEAFHDRLKKGVGRHAAYGYGMLLLRPPAPTTAVR